MVSKLGHAEFNPSSSVFGLRIRCHDAAATNGEVGHADSQRFVCAQHLKYERVFPPVVIIDEMTVGFVQCNCDAVVAAAKRYAINLKFARKLLSLRH